MNFLTFSNEKLVNIGIFALRLVAGVILFASGASKIFGWFGGFGLEATLGYYTKMGISVPLAYLSMYTEFLGGLLLVLGLFARIAGIAILINMLVAVIYSVPLGFLLGVSYPLIFLGADLAILLIGPMKYSLDQLIWPFGPSHRP